MPDRPQKVRRGLHKCRRLVVKIGSKALAEDPSMFERVARNVSEAVRRPKGRASKSAGRQAVLVSSGAIALGIEHLSMRRRPRQMAGLQAAAAAGQSRLMRRYADVFEAEGHHVAQVLLTHADLANRVRANNARDALNKLLELGVIPIVNENDAVAVDEIRFGDNDALAAMVTPLCEADLLLLLSDVEGLLDHEGARVPFAPVVDDRVRALVTGETSRVGTGGMRSKLEAARTATIAGAHVVIAPAHGDDVIQRVLAGEDVGTLFPAVSKRLRQRKHWIAYTLRPRGAAIIDDGAASAIEQRGRSVLCVGVLGVRGQFAPGDAISLVAPDGREVARGLTRLSAADASRLAGGSTPNGSEILVHRDDLVVMPPP